MKKRIVITGAAGSVGTALRPQLLQRGYAVHSIDLQPIATEAGETACVADITDRARMTREFDGADCVVHLAACTRDEDWPQQMQASVQGAIDVFEAARAAGVGRIVYASSNHVVGLYPRPPAGPVRGVHEVLRPDSRYGVGKAFGELLAAMFAYKYDMRVLSVRIGNVGDRPLDRRRMGLWLSPRDLGQLVALGIEHPTLRFEIVYGISDRTGLHYDNAAAYALGYAPQDGILAEDVKQQVLQQDPPPAPGSAAAGSAAEVSLGGTYTQAEFVGSAQRLFE